MTSPFSLAIRLFPFLITSAEGVSQDEQPCRLGAVGERNDGVMSCNGKETPYLYRRTLGMCLHLFGSLVHVLSLEQCLDLKHNNAD